MWGWRSSNWRWAGVMRFGNAGGLLLNIDAASWFKVTQEPRSAHPKKGFVMLTLLKRSLLPCGAFACDILDTIYFFKSNRRYKSRTNYKIFSWSFFISFPIFPVLCIFIPLRLPHLTPTNVTYVAQADVSDAACACSSGVSLFEPSSIKYLHPNILCLA